MLPEFQQGEQVEGDRSKARTQAQPRSPRWMGGRQDSNSSRFRRPDTGIGRLRLNLLRHTLSVYLSNDRIIFA
jgi:hypothetical protein